MRKFLLIVVVLTVNISLYSQESAVDSLWNDAVSAYSEANYEKALSGFKQLETSGYISPELFYNIGNSYYKMQGYLPYSILYYEKALKMDPSYEDAKNNLMIAQQFTVDRIEEVPEFVLITWVKEIRNLLSSNTWAYISIAIFAIVALLLIFFRYSRSLVKRKLSFIFALLFFILFMVSIFFSISLKLRAGKADEAIIINPVSSVKSSPSDSGKTLLIIHEGTKVDVLEDLGEWRKIELSDGRQGWLVKRDIEVI